VDYEVVWAPAALEDIESLAEYIERDSAFYARAVVDKILDTAKRLKEFPLAGRTVPEIENEKIR
jgi:toxin ParE1/3/4